jgi:hypothetical protein
MVEKNAEGWPRVHYSHSSGQTSLGLELYADPGRPLTENDKSAVYDAMETLEKELHAESARLHPDNIAWKARWLDKARLMFSDAGLAPIYVCEIDNKYCGPKCCPHRVWLLVTTPRGIIEVGWRKSVMVIDWSASDVKATAEELFADQDVTKGERMIHAWSYERATEYLTRIGASRPPVLLQDAAV